MADRPRPRRGATKSARRAPTEIPREYGYGILSAACAEYDHYLAITVPEAWAMASTMLGRPPRAVHHVKSLDSERVPAEVRRLPVVDAVLGIGGGSALDFAKYVAWQRDLPLVLAPSVTSVDACLTESIALRRDGRVQYVGEVYPERVLVDFELVCSAPVEMNRAGAADILSIHTALFDWRLAAQRGKDTFDDGIARQAQGLIDKLMAHADEVREAKPAGIITLIELFWGEVILCRQARSSRPEEGSEHFWAYCAEHATGRRMVHGELVALGIMLMSSLQENQPGEIRTKLDALGIRPKPQALGFTEKELRDTLLDARVYAEGDRLAYSILNDREITPVLADQLVAAAGKD